MNIRWNGDFTNEAKSGQIIAQNGNLLTIKWEDGKQQVIPEFVTKGQGWTRACFGSLENLINSGRLNSSQLRSLHSALRSLSHLAWDTAAEIDNKAKRPWEY